MSFQSNLTHQLNQWRQDTLNIAVIGSAGQGKSSFINAIRKLKHGDPDFAPVHEHGSTKSLHQFADPNDPMIKYWDLPGVGGGDFKKGVYLQKVKFEKYDFFLILSCTRFTEDDEWLAGEITKCGKKFMFLRTKIDEDIRNRQTRGLDDAEEYLAKLREELVNNLTGVSTKDIFLIDNNYYYLTPTIPVKEAYDFPVLIIQLATRLPKLKRKRFLLSMYINHRKLTAEKARLLRDRIPEIGRRSGAAGNSTWVDANLVVKEIEVYRKEFELDNESLLRTSEISSVDFATLQGIVYENFPPSSFTPDGVRKMMNIFSGSKHSIAAGCAAAAAGVAAVAAGGVAVTAGGTAVAAVVAGGIAVAAAPVVAVVAAVTAVAAGGVAVGTGKFAVAAGRAASTASCAASDAVAATGDAVAKFATRTAAAAKYTEKDAEATAKKFESAGESCAAKLMSVIPMGPTIGSVVSYETMVCALNRILDRMQEMAEQIWNTVAERCQLEAPNVR